MNGEFHWLHGSRLQEGADVTYGDDKVLPSKSRTRARSIPMTCSCSFEELSAGVRILPAEEMKVQLIENGQANTHANL